MQKDTRILQKIEVLRKDMEANWTAELERLNVWNDVDEFYYDIMHGNEDQRWVANTIFAFVVLAYHASSDWLQITGDRLENKKKIMKSLAGISWQTNVVLVDAVLGDSTDNNHGRIDKLIEWFINDQKDWRWSEIISNKEFYSKANILAQGANSIKDMKEAGQMKDSARLLNEKADQYLDAIRKEYVDLDSALKKEGKVMITERLANDKSSWELFILQRNNRAEVAESLEKAAKEGDEGGGVVDVIVREADDIDDEPF